MSICISFVYKKGNEIVTLRSFLFRVKNTLEGIATINQRLAELDNLSIILTVDRLREFYALIKS